MSQRLRTLIAELDAAGVDSDVLGKLEPEVDALSAPPGAISRMGQSLIAAARGWWSNLMGEVEESQELWALVQRRLAGDVLTDAETETAQAQVYDLVRMVPAGIIAVAVEAVPVPGTSLVTPWLLAQLGLMPSRWREAHVLDALREEAQRLAPRHPSHAAAISQLGLDLAEEADRRDRLVREDHLLADWDADSDGIWDPSEQDAHDAALARARAADPSARQWFLRMHAHIFGPLSLTELPADLPPLLTCLDGDGAWLRLEEVRA